MREKIQTILLYCFVILGTLLLISAITFAKPKARLAMIYLAQTNQAGQSLAFFAITNAGNISVAGSRSGSLEILGESEHERVGCETKLSQLNPGECDVATVHLPRPMSKPWRFTIYYSRAGSGRRGYSASAETSDWVR
jgi:hypothetical protein